MMIGSNMNFHNSYFFILVHFLCFCSIGPKRVIIREGQKAYNFYFILSGTVVITEWSPVTKSSQTKCMLQRGMEFGVSQQCTMLDLYENKVWADTRLKSFTSNTENDLNKE